MSRLLAASWLAAIVLTSVSACGDPAPGPTQAEQDFEDAQRRLPTLGDVQAQVLTQTCSPNPGVCHSGREYPQLHTVGDLLATVSTACNVAPPDPLLGWDACERAPHWLQLGEHEVPIAWTLANGESDWTLVVPEPLPADVVDEPLRIVTGDDVLVFAPAPEWTTVATLSAEGTALSFSVQSEDGTEIGPVVASVMRGVIGGDPNRNGIWGASGPERDHARLIVPGSRRRSYLWRRLVGDVPGTRMPIANGPVTNPQLLALGCWIEGLPADPMDLDPSDPIDYENCSFAEDPPMLVEGSPEPAQDTD